MIDPLEAKFQAWERELELEHLKQNSGQFSPPVPDQVARFYHILGLPTQASVPEIKQAYRALLKKWHPDRFQNDPERQHKAKEVTQKMNEIYNQLCNQPGD